jgi:hypothetical protein
MIYSSQSFPLVVPDADAAYDRDDEVIAAFPMLWAPEYQSEFADSVRIAIGRGQEEIKKQFKKVRTAERDVVLTLERPTRPVHLRGDYRYSSEKMTTFLCTTPLDLIPPLVGWTAAGGHLLDGHHRWRAYAAAGIQPLILSIRIEPQSGSQPQVVANVDVSALSRDFASTACAQWVQP